MPSNPDATASSETPGKNSAASADGFLTRLSELAWQALPAIGSAIGFAGFVAVIGAAIEWVRFDAAHLPATQAVLALPRQELVIIGALALAGFVLGGVLAVLLVYMIDNNGDTTLPTVRGLVAVGVIEMSVTLFFIEEHHILTYLLLGVWLAVIGIAAASVVGAAMDNFRSRAKLKSARAKVIDADDKLAAALVARSVTDRAARQEPADDTAKQARQRAHRAVLEAEEAWQRAIHAWVAAADEIIASRRKSARKGMAEARDKVSGYLTDPPNSVALESGLDEAERELGHVFHAIDDHLVERLSTASVILKRKVREVLKDKAPKALDDEPLEGRDFPMAVRIGALVVLASLVVGVVLVATKGPLSWLAIVLGVVALLATMNLFVARATEQFAWYGVSVFFSVLLFGATLTIARTMAKPSVQPIALVRKGDDLGLCGVYVTQTSDRVYVGRLPPDSHQPGLIFWVPTSEVELVSVGHLEPVDGHFPELAASMLVQLYKDRAEEPAPVLKNTTVTEVVGSEVKPGSSTGKQTTTVTESPPRKVRPSSYPKENAPNTCT